jgi:hypothetical protein
LTPDAPDDQPSNEIEAPDIEGERAIAFIETGSDLAGALAGAAVGLLGGPVGAFGGAAVGVSASRAIKRAGRELYERVLAPREHERAGAVLAETTVVTSEKLAEGKELRDDGFFNASERGRSDGDELLEAVLQRAARTYQERKLPYLSRLWPNVATSADIRPAYGHLLAQLADDLTYDGMVAMAFVATTDEELEREKMYADADQSEGGPRQLDVVAELDRLAALDLVGVRGDGEIVQPLQRFPGASGFRELPLMRTALTPTGEALLRVLELDRIPIDEQRGFLSRLSGNDADS